MLFKTPSRCHFEERKRREIFLFEDQGLLLSLESTGSLIYHLIKLHDGNRFLIKSITKKINICLVMLGNQFCTVIGIMASVILVLGFIDMRQRRLCNTNSILSIGKIIIQILKFSDKIDNDIAAAI